MRVIFTGVPTSSDGDYTRPLAVSSLTHQPGGRALSGFRILCPNCGERPAAEFAYGGELVNFPAGGVETLQENYERVWTRANRRGPQTEEWFHRAGCRRWFTTVRDTATNERC